MESENTLQLANKHGVPTPETCKELNWQEETLFAWYYDNASETHVLKYLNETDLGLSFIAYAPQIHELMAKMPTSILNDDVFDYSLCVSKDEVSYFSFAIEIFLCVVYVSSEIGVTESLAQLYIKLRKEELL